MKICSDYLNTAQHGKTMSARVRSIAAGYWRLSDYPNKFIASRRPPTVDENDFIKIKSKDVQNIISKYSHKLKPYFLSFSNKYFY